MTNVINLLCYFVMWNPENETSSHTNTAVVVCFSIVET